MEEGGLDPTYKGGDSKETHLHHAAQFGNIPWAKYLLSLNNVNIRDKNRWGETPLDLALRPGRGLYQYGPREETATFLREHPRNKEPGELFM